jgi:hypothetical protein
VATAVVALIVLAGVAAPARAATTRAEYVAQAEPICQAAQKPTIKAYVVADGRLPRP